MLKQVLDLLIGRSTHGPEPVARLPVPQLQLPRQAIPVEAIHPIIIYGISLLKSFRVFNQFQPDS